MISPWQLLEAMAAAGVWPLKEPIVGGIADANRKLAVRALHVSLGDRMPMPLAEFAEMLAIWEVIPIVDQQEVIGAVIRNGSEVHVGMTRTPSGAARWVIRNVLTETIARHGRAITSVMCGNQKGLRFCQRLGFYIVDDSNMSGRIAMECVNPRHARGGIGLKGTTP